VWFDDIDEGGISLPSPRLFVRCHYAEEPALEKAVDLLADLGHSRVGYPALRFVPEPGPWMVSRLERLRAICSRRGMELIAPTASAYRSREDSLGGLTARLEALATVGEPASRAVMQRMQRFVSTSPRTAAAENPWKTLARALQQSPRPPRLAELVRQAQEVGAIATCLKEGATALVAANDEMAIRVVAALRRMSIAVPGRLSLVSFDNYPAIQAYPVSSVDFGFGYLGYAAFHALLRDIPLPRDTNSDIATRPHVLRRGSVGRPGSLPRRRFSGMVW
jgi:DNA-binding LacI/PurR family transcriptional regulator